ncbi:hypothetical protein RHMOL_Rhmol04G0227300 [Rhododendron molle]|uniref:Uncharacterized protein n=1 Tax=Rhododendron molle TaxID=49168 RepID=A0ACC0P5S2_RHOML|nr:hypothetical protein RHMOL_Rhmol04G0227300 [Rhododendron molle]
MAAAMGFRRGFSWKGTDGGRHFPKQDRDVSVSQPILGLSGGFPDDGNRRIGGEDLRRGTNQDEIGARDSRLREIDDRTLVAINGNQFRMGDLVATSSHNSKGNAIGSDLVDKTKGVVLRDTEGSDFEMGSQPVSAHAQQLSQGALENSILKLGHEVSSGPGPLLISQEVDMGTGNNEFIGLDQLVDIQIFNAPAEESVRSNKGVPGQKRGSIGKKGTVGVGLQRSRSRDSQTQKGIAKEAHFNGLGKRRLEDGDMGNKEVSGGKRILLGDVTNSRVEVANPKGPPTIQ